MSLPPEVHSAARVPAPPLDRYIEVLWYQRIPIYSAREVILPSPYIELIINFGQPHKVFTRADLSQFDWHRDSWLAGLQSQWLGIESSTSHMIGARLKPGGAAAFLPDDIRKLSDRVTPLDAILGAEAATLREELLAITDDEARFDVLENFLRARLDEARPGLDLALSAVARLEAAAGDLGIGELAAILEVSHKHLIDVFTSTVGLRPKQFARVLRFASVLPDLLSDAAPDWAALAQRAGYHDQSHFNREFHDFSGLTPSQYLELRAEYAGDYSEGDDTRFVPLG